jgi:hypothetical protein
VSSPPDPEDGGADVLPPFSEPLQPITLQTVLTAVLYLMRNVTGEEWCRKSGGRLPSVRVAAGSGITASLAAEGGVNTVVHGAMNPRSGLFVCLLACLLDGWLPMHVHVRVRDNVSREVGWCEDGCEAEARVHTCSWTTSKVSKRMLRSAWL